MRSIRHQSLTHTGPQQMSGPPNHWQRVSSRPCELGESPFWHPLEQLLYWIDIAGRQILRANVHTGAQEWWDLPAQPGCIAPAAGGGLVMALGGLLSLFARLAARAPKPEAAALPQAAA